MDFVCGEKLREDPVLCLEDLADGKILLEEVLSVVVKLYFTAEFLEAELVGSMLGFEENNWEFLAGLLLDLFDEESGCCVLIFI